MLWNNVILLSLNVIFRVGLFKNPFVVDRYKHIKNKEELKEHSGQLSNPIKWLSDH